MSVSEDLSQRSEFKIWQCVLCAYVYDEALGDPDGGVVPGTRWEDVPDDWVCPECGARKGEFDMIVVG